MFRCYLWSFLNKQTSWLALLFVSSSLLGACSVAGPYITKVIIDTVSENYTENFTTCIAYLLMIFMGYQILNNFSWRISSYVVYKLQLGTKDKIIRKICENMLDHSYNYFQDIFVGQLSNNIRTIASCSESIIYDLSRVIISFVLFVISLLCMYQVHSLFFYGLLIWSVFFMLMSISVSQKIFRLSENYGHNLSKVFGIISDCIINISNIKAFSNKKYEIESLDKNINEMNESFKKKELSFLKIAFSQGLYTSLLISAMLFLLIFLKTKHLVTLGDFVLILGLSSQITDHIWNATEIVHKINENIGMCNQCIKSILIPIEITDKKEAATLLLKKGGISFKDVSFGYSNSGTLFHDLNLNINPKERIGLVGHSGSGKTTFINLLLRFYEPTSGKICIDGADISEVTQESLHSCISVISQDSILFHRSVLENIRYGRLDSTNDDVIMAAKYANAHEFIENLSDGYNTIIGERGTKLSGGQRQRISIARAILKNSPILIMDEATSQLDSVTEMYLQEVLDDLIKDKTVITAAHRISTVSKMDKIFVFENGRINCSGSHGYLLKNSELYKQLWKHLRC